MIFNISLYTSKDSNNDQSYAEKKETLYDALKLIGSMNNPLKVKVEKSPCIVLNIV